MKTPHRHHRGRRCRRRHPRRRHPRRRRHRRSDCRHRRRPCCCCCWCCWCCCLWQHLQSSRNPCCRSSRSLSSSSSFQLPAAGAALGASHHSHAALLLAVPAVTPGYVHECARVARGHSQRVFPAAPAGRRRQLLPLLRPAHSARRRCRRRTDRPAASPSHAALSCPSTPVPPPGTCNPPCRQSVFRQPERM